MAVESPENSVVASHQEQLDQLQTEVAALREQLRRAQRLAAMGTMTAMVAHEFNNILTPIINYAQMAQSNPKLVEKAISKAADGGTRATHICQSLLRMTHDSQQDSAVNVADLVADTLSAMARDVRKDGIDLVLDIPGDLVVTTRRSELQQVLLNLLINARTAILAKEGGEKRLEIRAKRHEDRTLLHVSDSGVGIAPENLEKIFEPFFTTRPDDGDEDKGGHGLGLAICHDIVRSMGGDICVQSVPDHGATFQVRLPS